MTLATFSVFANVGVDRVFVMPSEEGESVDWPIAPRLIDLSPVEFRTLELICSGYSLSRETAKGYASKFSKPISLSIIEGGVLAKPRSKGLIGSRPVGEALVHGATEPGRLIARS